MRERARLGKGLVTANLISFTVSAILTIFSNLLVGLITFAITLPVSAYLSSKIINKVED